MKVYNPKWTVQLRRECDGVVEYERVLTVTGGTGYHLQELVAAALNLVEIPQSDNGTPPHG